MFPPLSHHHFPRPQLGELSTDLIKIAQIRPATVWIFFVNNPTWASKCPQKNWEFFYTFSKLCQKVSIDSNFPLTQTFPISLSSLAVSLCAVFSRLLNNIDPHTGAERERETSPWKRKMKTSWELWLRRMADTGLSWTWFSHEEEVNIKISVDGRASRMREIFVLYIFRVAR